MTEIKHHLSDQLLMGYAAGALPEAFNIVVASHISLCDECRARLGAFETVGGAMMDAGETAAMDEDSFAKTMKLIGARRKDAIRPPRRVADGVLPAPLRDYVGGDIDRVKWRAVGAGVRQAILGTSRDATARLLYIPAGTRMPDHGHRGTELTMVLQGAFSDECDRFARGDVEIADEEMEHTPVAEAGTPCICLAATDAPLRFNSWLPRIAQPFLRI